jgi:acetyl-CoA acetyltransferase
MKCRSGSVANTFAMTAHRHMKEFGTTPEQLAEVAVIQRRHASRTPGAQQTTPITVDDVLNSGIVTTPYHKLDCSLISDGAAAFIPTSADYAKAIGIEAPIYILGGGECYTHEHIFLMPSLTTTGAVESSRRAYAMAGYGPADMDVAGVYDRFTGTVIMMLEDLGFCPKGEGGRFVADGHMTYGGRILPTQTAACCRPPIPEYPDRCFIPRSHCAVARRVRDTPGCRTPSLSWCIALAPDPPPMQQPSWARGIRYELA